MLLFMLHDFYQSCMLSWLPRQKSNAGKVFLMLFGCPRREYRSWSDHAANEAKSFASKLSLLRRMRFLPQKQLEDFYTKVILPSVTYGLTVWGSCNKTHLNNLEKLHARAGRIVYGLPWDTSAEDVLMRTGWDSLETMYKLRLTEFVFKCLKGYTVTEFKEKIKKN